MAVDDAYTKSLLHLNGANNSTTFTDESGKTWTAAGAARLSTASPRFGSAWGYFDGSTLGGVLTTYSPDFAFGSGDFTIDFWALRGEAADASYSRYISGSANVDGISDWSVGVSNDYLRFSIWTTGGSYITIIQSSAKFVQSDGVTHIAIVRYGNSLTLYRNGISVATQDVTGVSVRNSAFKLGLFRLGEFGGYGFNGNVDEFRISKGIARWTSNFTPPSAEYSAIAAFKPKVMIY